MVDVDMISGEVEGILGLTELDDGKTTMRTKGGAGKRGEESMGRPVVIGEEDGETGKEEDESFPRQGKQIYCDGKDEEKWGSEWKRYWKEIKALVFENSVMEDELQAMESKIINLKRSNEYMLNRLCEHEASAVFSNQNGGFSLSDDESSAVLVKKKKKKVAEGEPASKEEGAVNANVAKLEPKKENREKNTNRGPPAPMSTVLKPTGLNVIKRRRSAHTFAKRCPKIKLDENGNPVFPIRLGGLAILSLGEIDARFHTSRYIWPIGFKSTRDYPSLKENEKRALYECEILEDDGNVLFKVTPEEDRDSSIIEASASAAVCKLLKVINETRQKETTNTASGPEFFGYAHPSIMKLIQSMPKAKECTKYKPKTFLPS
eukprot:Nk52_evm41s236 gene=Nk52_evmTU41s236